MASTAEVIFYAGESYQRPDLKLQQWEKAKDAVRYARQRLELLRNNRVHYVGCGEWRLRRKQLQSQEIRQQVTNLYHFRASERPVNGRNICNSYGWSIK